MSFHFKVQESHLTQRGASFVSKSIKTYFITDKYTDYVEVKHDPEILVADKVCEPTDEFNCEVITYDNN